MPIKTTLRGLPHMKLLKSAVLAVSLGLTLGAVSTTAVACEDGRTCYGPAEAINIVLGHIGSGMKALNEAEDKTVVLAHIKAALNTSKEINANDVVDRNRMRANAHLKKARSATRKGKAEEATAHLEAAEKGFSALKGML